MRRMAAPSWAAVVFLVVASSSVHAQQANAGGTPLAQVPTEQAGAPVSAAALPAGPALAAPTTAEATSTVADRLRPVADARLLTPAQETAQRELVHQPAYRASRGVPLMIVGGAMFLAGAIIDDRAGDAVMVAGVVVAAIGLLEYLQ